MMEPVKVTLAMIKAARATGPDFDDRVFTIIYQAMHAARDSDGTAIAADCEDNPVQKDSQPRAETNAQKSAE